MTTQTDNSLLELRISDLEEWGETLAARLQVFGERLYLAGIFRRSAKGRIWAKVYAIDAVNMEWQEAYSEQWHGAAKALTDRQWRVDIAVGAPSEAGKTPAMLLNFTAPGDNFQLLSRDGRAFKKLTAKPKGEREGLALASVFAHQGRLYAIPDAGTATAAWQGSVLARMIGHQKDTGRWEAVSQDLLLKAGQGISRVGGFQRNDYLAVSDAQHGFQLWLRPRRKRAKWHCVLEKGATRYANNPDLADVCEFNGDLYLATPPWCADQGNMHYVDNDSGELIRLYPDDSWDLIVGSARFTLSGLKVPLSDQPPGFGASQYRCISRLLNHDRQLWLVLQGAEGFRLLASDDGVDFAAYDFSETAEAGELDPQEPGRLTDMASTPWGLALLIDDTAVSGGGS
jgi:hypothetical protein